MSDLLAEVVRVTTAVTDTAVLLDRVARLLTVHADVVVADRLDDPDLVTRVAAYGPGGALALPRAMGSGSASRRSAAGSLGLLPAVVAAPSRVLLLDHATLLATAGGSDVHSAAQASFALSFGIRELLVVGLVARDAVLGVLTLGTSDRFPAGVRDEVALVAAQVGLALDAARLLAVQRAVSTAMQTSLLPAVPTVAGLTLAARYRPAAEGLDVGGDWYDAFDTPAGLAVVIGDVSGHDVAAAARMADLRNILRAYAVDGTEPPSVVVGRLDRAAAALGLDVMATCVVGTILRPATTGEVRFRWTNAGHLPPVLLHAGTARLLESGAELVLGVDPATVRTDQEVDLAPGDTLVLYTDGLVEIRGTDLDDRLETLRAAVQDGWGQSPDELADVLLGRLAQEAPDDVALLLLQVLPAD